MPRFSSRSLEKLLTCHPDLQRLFMAVIEDYDCTILCGHRTEAEQALAFDAGHSKVRWPHSKHNAKPSLAVDVAPYPIDWEDHARFGELASFVKIRAFELGIDVVWGGDWKTFKDLPHWELATKKNKAPSR